MRTIQRHFSIRCGLTCCAALAAALAGGSVALGGGTPENLLLILDPSNNDSLYIGNYYKNARQVPDQNVLYMAPGAANYPAFVNNNLPALFGFLANAATDDHIDYIVVMPGAPFYVSAPGLVSDGCSPVTRFSISGCYTMAFIANEVLAGGMPSTRANEYFFNTVNNGARAFDSSTSWLAGQPSTSSSAKRYFIGAMLGYTGARGNTLAEIIANIDRSVAADGTHATGTFYFMNNPADSARNVRAAQYQTVVDAIISYAGQAVILGTTQQPAVLPIGQHDCLGIMTGASDPAIDSGDFTILPGAFCDHLTSWAAMFDNASQVKLSRWIVKGASGSWGEVEEPCNYTGKFPQARLHLFAWRGMSLGEIALRTVGYVPFQGLLYGDPMSRAFAYLPAVTVPDAPGGPVSGTITLTPAATGIRPGANLASFDLLIDGLLYGSAGPTGSFSVDTTQLADGWHDLRVLAYEDLLPKETGRWTGSLTVNNRGRTASLTPAPASGNWNTPFTFDVTAAGAAVREVRVVQNGRVVAAAPGSSATLTVYGLTLGAGPVRAYAEALLADGARVRSAPYALDVAYAGAAPSGQPPVAYGYTKRVRGDQPFVVELPATFDDPAVPLTFTILSGPAQATPATGQSGPYRLMRPAPNAVGIDYFTFQVTSSTGTSNVATVTLAYDFWFGDMNCDGAVNGQDIDGFVTALFDPSQYALDFPNCNILNGDFTGDGQVNGQDIDGFVAALFGG